MKQADNFGRHKISDEFEFQPDRLFPAELFDLESYKNTIFDLVRSIASLILIGSL